ncbi:response regulator transcription factor [Kordiimonas pumila]|uniref:LuxR C-terminal-related transcriptional regulator n=1 Tax=Kordiimonas pumila TaxID=2161677 RepID=A0ABV7D4D1_9PROT|nr:response regulator transcription factor [Kordiimonas pumila]
MKALIIDGEELYRLSVREVVALAGRFTDIIEIGTEQDFLSKTASYTDVSLIVLHADSMKNPASDWIKLIRRLYPGVSILVITNAPGDTAFRFLGTTVLPRSAAVPELIAAIRKALHLPADAFQAKAPTTVGTGIQQSINTEFSRFRKNIDAHEPSIDLTKLSYRQKQILAMAAAGLPNKEIAARLRIAEGTVKAHMHAIFKVMGVSNRTQAVIRYGASGHNIASSDSYMARPERQQQSAVMRF